MEKFTCPKCKKTTYTAYMDIAYICPFCNTEKLIIFNPQAFNTGHNISDAKIIFDRRTSDTLIAKERRQNANSEYIPIAWLLIKQRPMDNNKI